MLEGNQVAVMMRTFIESAKRFLQGGYLVLAPVLWGEDIATLKCGALAKDLGCGSYTSGLLLFMISCRPPLDKLEPQCIPTNHTRNSQVKPLATPFCLIPHAVL